MNNMFTHSQKKQLTPLYIFISVSFELSLYIWIGGLDDDIQVSELFLLRVQLPREQIETRLLTTQLPID